MVKHLWLLIVLIIVAGCASEAPKEKPSGFVLVTPFELARDERLRDSTPPRSPEPKRELQSPDIVLLRPATLHDVLSPTDIELQFLAKEQTQIDMRTLRVMYGTFGINITDRLMKHATVTDAGIVAREASLPAGSHLITIEIADNQKRVTRESFRFIVKELKK